MPNKIEALAKNEEFIAELEKLQSEEEIISLFKTNGVEITSEELKSMVISGENEELDENLLDDVSGGAIGYVVGYAVARWLKNKSSLGGGKGAFGGGGVGSR